MAVYEKPPKRQNGPSRGKHRRDLIAEYNKQYSDKPMQGDAAKPSAPKTGDKKA